MSSNIKKFCPMLSTTEKFVTCDDSCAWYVKEILPDNVPENFPQTGSCALRDIALELRTIH